jgi:hypothetical protein
LRHSETKAPYARAYENKKVNSARHDESSELNSGPSPT